MADSYKFPREFRQKILKLMLDDRWMASYGSAIIIPQYFDQEDEEHVAAAILRYRETYRSSPKDKDDLIVLAGEEYEEFIQTLFRDTRDTKLAADMVLQFAQAQAAKLAILESIDDVENGDLSRVVDRVRAAADVGKNITSDGIDPFSDVESWLYDIWNDSTRTGMLHVDRILKGGLSGGELGAVLGPPNRGKTMVLLNIGYGAASIGSNKNVIHFSHEMNEKKVSKRYAARVTFRFPSPDDDLKQYAEEVYEASRRLVPGKIRVIDSIGRKMTHNELEMHVKRLQDQGFNPGLIIDDYLDIMAPVRRYNDRRFEYAATWEWYRSFLNEVGLPGWTATQGNRASLSKEIITMANIAEDITKAAIADVIIALCQTRDEARADRCRLYMAKVRDGQSQDIIEAKYYSEQQAIITTGTAKYVEKDSETDV